MRKIFVDTNILIFATFVGSPFNEDARAVLKNLSLSGAELVISSQVLREYACNMTAHKYALRAAVERNITRFQQMTVLYDTPSVFQRWNLLMQQYTVSGKAVYDCNIVATMLEHGVSEIVTHNVKDFTRYAALLNVIPFVPSSSTTP